MEFQHASLAAGRWSAMTIADQLGNVGSEVNRAISWRARRNREQSGRALDRMLELMDLTLADGRWSGRRRREIARVREGLCDSFFGDGVMGGMPESWMPYFDAFARVARREAERRSFE